MKKHRLAVLVLFLLVAALSASCSGRKNESAEAQGPGASQQQAPAQASPEGAPAGTQQPPSGTPRVDRGTGLLATGSRPQAPPTSGTLLDGSPWNLAENKGKVVLVDFWATWCPPCRRSIPHLIDFQKEYGSRGLVVVGVSLDQQGKRVVDPYVKQAGINYPIIVDETGKLAEQYGGVQGIPTMFMIDREGRIARMVQGYVPKDSIDPAVKALLDET